MNIIDAHIKDKDNSIYLRQILVSQFISKSGVTGQANPTRQPYPRMYANLVPGTRSGIPQVYFFND